MTGESLHDRRAATLLAETRRRAALTQAEVAQNAGLPQSTVSAYESGRRQPTLPMLSKLLEAMHQELTIGTEQRPESTATLTGPRGTVLRRHRREVREVARRHGVDRVSVVGPVAQGTERTAASIDLLVDAGPAATVVSLHLLQVDLDELLGRPVNITASDSLNRKDRDRMGRQAIEL